MEKMPTKINKIFGIGLSKTATTSLARALRMLDITTKDFPSLEYVPHRLKGIKQQQLNDYQAFTDVSVVPFYKKLDEQYPNSKFIYTVRDMESWLKSCQNYPRFQRPFYKLPLKVIKLRQTVYHTIKFDAQQFEKAYHNHHKEVLTYFADRPDDLLIFDICGGESWQVLCDFLDLPIPEKAFPFANAKKNNYV